MMDPITKDYIDSRDEVVESRVNADIVRIYATMDSMRTTIETQGKASEMRDLALERRMDRVEKHIGSLRKTVIVTGISIVLGVAGLNATILQNMQASFDSGRQVSAAQAEVQRQSRETDVRLKEIDGHLAKTDEKLRQIDVLYDTIQKKVFPERPPGAR